MNLKIKKQHPYIDSFKCNLPHIVISIIKLSAHTRAHTRIYNNVLAKHALFTKIKIRITKTI